MSYETWVIGGGPPPPATAEASPDPNANFSDDDAWFAGRLPRKKAEKVLSTMPDGAFLVRESDARLGEYSLSIVYQQVKHIKINRTGNKYDVAPDSKAFPSIQELVRYFQLHSLNRHFPGMETTLKIPFRDVLDKQSDARGAVGRARARFAYKASNEDELSFERGAELVVLSKTEADDGWWKGRLPIGEVGLFPANHVQPL
jgi:guanine nucleotide exchange factor VAV